MQTAGLGGTPAFQHRPGTAKVRPKRALIDAPSEHHERWITIIRSRHSGRRSVNSGHSPGPSRSAENFSMRGAPGFFDIEVRLEELSAKGDDRERLMGIVDFEIFRADLERAVPRADRAKGGRLESQAAKAVPVWLELPSAGFPPTSPPLARCQAAEQRFPRCRRRWFAVSSYASPQAARSRGNPSTRGPSLGSHPDLRPEQRGKNNFAAPEHLQRSKC